MTGSIPVAPFKERALHLVQTRQASWNGLAMRAGWKRRMNHSSRPSSTIQGDTARLKRAVGVLAHHTTHNGVEYHNYNQTVSEATAQRLMVALEMDPVDVGL